MNIRINRSLSLACAGAIAVAGLCWGFDARASGDAPNPYAEAAVKAMQERYGGQWKVSPTSSSSGGEATFRARRIDATAPFRRHASASKVIVQKASKGQPTYFVPSNGIRGLKRGGVSAAWANLNAGTQQQLGRLQEQAKLLLQKPAVQAAIRTGQVWKVPLAFGVSALANPMFIEGCQLIASGQFAAGLTKLLPSLGVVGMGAASQWKQVGKVFSDEKNIAKVALLVQDYFDGKVTDVNAMRKRVGDLGFDTRKLDEIISQPGVGQPSAAPEAFFTEGRALEMAPAMAPAPSATTANTSSRGKPPKPTPTRVDTVRTIRDMWNQ